MNETAGLTVKLENRSCNIVNVGEAESGIKRDKKKDTYRYLHGR